MNAFTPTPRSRLRRKPERAHYDRGAIHAVLDAHFICHVGYVVDGQPYVTPTSYWRDGDRLYWHGSSASRMLRHLRDGAPACVTVTHCDGLVLARSGFHSSINYRSVMAFGTARALEDEASKLAAMKAFVERLTPGRWDELRPVTKQERKQLKALPFSEKRFQKTTGAKQLVGEKGYSTVERIWARPTLDINGIYGGYTEEGAKTVIASKASAKFSTRLVADQDPATITKLVKKHIEKITPKSVRMKFTVHSEGDGWIAPFDHPIVQAGKTALEKGFKKKAVFIREGGSIPLVPMMYKAFKKPCVLLGFGLPDENAHAPNERLNLENFQKGILSLAYFYDEVARANGAAPKQGKKGSKRRR